MQPSPDLREIVERLERLDRQNRHLTRGMFGAAILAFAGLLACRLGPKGSTIEGEAFVLKDSAGRVRAKFGLSAAPIAPEVQKYVKGPEIPTPALVFFDEDGRIAARLEGSKLSFYDGSGARLALFYNVMGSALHFYEANGDASLSITSAGGPVISLRDKAGYQLAAGASNLEAPRTGETTATSAASLLMFDKEGKVIWRAP